MSENGNG